MIYSSLKKWARRGYDQLIHGYDTTRNILVGDDGSVTYLEDLDLSGEPGLEFPTKFANFMTEMHGPIKSVDDTVDSEQ